jgi:hypothetical protein
MGKKPFYVNSEILEEWWYGWIVTKDEFTWEALSMMIYMICQGVATKFNPKSPEEHEEHTHDAWTQIMDKIRTGKLRYIHGKAPVFNLITTTAFRILFSKMNKQNKQKQYLAKYAIDMTVSKCPEMLPTLLNNSKMNALNANVSYQSYQSY